LSPRLIRLTACIGLTLGLAAPAMAEKSCNAQEVELRDANSSFWIPGGDREIASALTRIGPVVARVQTSGKKTSAPMFYLRGEAMKRTSKSSLPKEVRACVQQESRKHKGGHAEKRKAKAAKMTIFVFCDDLARHCTAWVCIGEDTCGMGGASW
jgi:hypothetical protein